MLNVKKRDGQIVPFELGMISAAIEKAFVAEHKHYTDEMVERIALRATNDFNSKVVDDCIGVEDIQNSVENSLIACGYVDVAKTYMIYRRQHTTLREMKSTELDYKKTVDNYLKIADWRVKENYPI